jgi:hypothetical protein
LIYQLPKNVKTKEFQMKKILSVVTLSAMVLSQSSAFASQNNFFSSDTTAVQNENLPTDQLRSAVFELVKLAYFIDGSEGDQIISLVEELIAAIEARNGEEVFNKGRDLLQLIAQIAQNDEINIQEGLDHVGRLVDAIKNQDSRTAAAAITDIALFIARIAKTLNG